MGHNQGTHNIHILQWNTVETVVSIFYSRIWRPGTDTGRRATTTTTPDLAGAPLTQQHDRRALPRRALWDRPGVKAQPQHQAPAEPSPGVANERRPGAGGGDAPVKGKQWGGVASPPTCTSL